MDAGFKNLLAQLTVVETGKERLLGGVGDDDGVGGLSSPTLCVLHTLGNVGLAESGQVFFIVYPDNGIVGGIGHHVAPLCLQLRDAQVDLLHAFHLVVGQQGTIAHEFLISLFQEFLVFALQLVKLLVVDLTNALKQLFVECYLILKVCELRLHLLLYLGNLRRLVGFGNGKEHACNAVEQLSALLKRQNGVLEGGRIRTVNNLLDIFALLLHGRLESWLIVTILYLAEVGCSKREITLL